MKHGDRLFEFDIEADLDFVWDALTTPEGLATWYVAAAEVDATVGGTLTVDWGTGAAAMGTFDVVEPPHRLRLVYAADADMPGAEEWLLSHDAGVTHVRLIHSLPVDDDSTWDETYPDITRGWSLFFATLQHVARRVGRLGRQSEVRLGSITDGAWTRVLATFGLDATPPAGATIDIADVTAEVLVAVNGYSLLLSADGRSTLLIDVEGQSLYTVTGTYGPEGAAAGKVLVAAAERACEAAGAG